MSEKDEIIINDPKQEHSPKRRDYEKPAIKEEDTFTQYSLECGANTPSLCKVEQFT